MNKNLLQLIIAALLLIIGYLVYDGRAHEPETSITVGEPVIVGAPASEATAETDEQTTLETESPKKENVSFSGVLLGFKDGNDETLGSFKYALVDDSTEIIRVDLRSIVGYDVLNLEDKIGAEVGQRVVIGGYIENGSFVATSVR